MTEKEMIFKALERTGAYIVGQYDNVYDFKFKNSYELLTLVFDENDRLSDAYI